MYTRDREGIVDEAIPPGAKPDVQAASCNKNLLFGHGPHLSDVDSLITKFKSNQFDTVTGLAIDQKVKSKLFLDPHYDPKTQTVLTSAQLAQSHALQNQTTTGTDTLSQAINTTGGLTKLNGTTAESEFIGPNIKRYGEVENLLEARRTTGFKSYNDFTKRFDQTHLNSQLRAPHYLRH